MRRALLILMAILTLGSAASRSQSGAGSELDVWLSAHRGELSGLYTHLHAHPELSHQEVETAARIARELKAAGRR